MIHILKKGKNHLIGLHKWKDGIQNEDERMQYYRKRITEVRQCTVCKAIQVQGFASNKWKTIKKGIKEVPANSQS